MSEVKTCLPAYFGEFGGMYVPEDLEVALLALEKAYAEIRHDESFQKELYELLTDYAGRPTPLTLCRNLTEGTKAKIYLKREDLLHGGAHKTNQVLGQVLLAKRMGKKEIIAETGAGQHGVATALGCALLGLKCRIYMGAKDIERQKPNVFRMRLMGAEVIPVTHGEATLKAACDEALRVYAKEYKTTHYLLGTAAGPHPYPLMVKEFQKIIGEEMKRQIMEKEGRLPDAVIACVGGGSNAIGAFTEFVDDESVALIGVEPGGLGVDTGKHGAAIQTGTPGVYFGMRAPLMLNDAGEVGESYSVAAGLDFPSAGPEHAYLQSIGRAKYVAIDDAEALSAFQELSEREGIIPALESSHALAYALKLVRENPEKEQTLIVNLSGRGDKDIFTVYELLNDKLMPSHEG